MRAPVLAARRISKSFNGVQVLFSVNFDLLPGEIHALVGENGAGKSTFVKIMSGFEQPSSGEILLDGKPVRLPANGQAEHLGIVIIHQEFNLAEHLTVTESLFLGREITRFGVLDRKRMRAETRRALDLLGSRIDENAMISSLPVADRQMVEIAKAISKDARVIFMDEPTAVLSKEESGVLFEQVRKLRDTGTSFVFVSHKLDEVLELTDRVTVLRDGQWVKTAPTSMLDGESIAQLMVGRELSSLYPAKREPDVDEEIVLSARGITTGFVRDASFDVRKGEVIGFSGLIGSGRTELMEAVAGLRPRHSGEVTIKGVPCLRRCACREPRGARLYDQGSQVEGPAARLAHGGEPDAAIARSAWQVRLSQPKSEANALARAMRRFDIRVRDGRVVAGRMSGGNQQKLMLAKVMETEPEIIIIDEPTRGIDVGTKQQIYHFISALARAGKSIVVVSSELQEVIGMCTRVAVMREGRIVGWLEGDEINEQEIMRYSAG